MSTGWEQLTPRQQQAAIEAAKLVEDADLQFVMLLYSDGHRGAIISNIEPANSVTLIEAALLAAKTKIQTEDIVAGRLQ